MLFDSRYERRFSEPSSKLACILFENQNVCSSNISCRAFVVSSVLYSEILGRGPEEENIREIPLLSILPQERLQSEDFILCNSSEAGPSHGARSS